MSESKLLFLGLFLALGVPVALAQDSSSAPSGPATSSEKPAKKVWTNDDLSDLRASASLSTSVNQNAKPANSGQKSPAARAKDAKWYHDQIVKLQAQLPPLNSQIAELQAALDGKPTGDTKTSQRPRGVKQDDWSVELADLQAKRADVHAKISALQDEARRNGVPNNALP